MRDLAARAAAGDQRAFAKIFERHHQELYRYCLAIVRNKADAEDALQSTMSKAIASLPGERRRIELRPWLFRVAHNEAISIIRRHRPESDHGLQGLSEPGPEIAAEQRERLRMLVGDLQMLPERQRSALVMRELSDLGYGEIAAALECSEGSARQTVYEARQALQTREEGRLMDCADARRELSDGDRRRLRNRRLRAHLADCDGCRDFQTAIAVRRNDLRVLTPPLPIAAASALLGGALGGGASAGAGAAAVGAGAGSVATGVGTGIAVKGASAAAAVVLAAGVADATGVIDLPTPLGDRNERAVEEAPAAGAPDGAGGSGQALEGAKGSGGGGGDSRGESNDAGKGGRGEGSPGSGGKSNGGSAGKSGDAPGQSGTTPGQSGTTPGQSGTTPGGSGTTPGQSGSVPGAGGSVPGQSGTTPGQSGTTPGQGSSTPAPSTSGAGQSSAAPGISGVAPEQSQRP